MVITDQYITIYWPVLAAVLALHFITYRTSFLLDF